MKTINKLLNKYPNYWLEIERNAMSSKWLVRIAKYPSSNSQHLHDNKILLEIGDTLEEAIKKLMSSVVAQDEKTLLDLYKKANGKK